MEIKNNKIMILGGAGLVGMAVCRELLSRNPGELIIIALTKAEVEEGIAVLKQTHPNYKITAEWGNIFVRTGYKDMSRDELLGNAEYRNSIIYDMCNELSETILSKSFLFHLIKKYKPKIIIDCINTATGVAYQDIFNATLNTFTAVKKARSAKTNIDECLTEVEKLMCTLYIPQLIRHIQIVYEATRRFGVKCYFKVGTSGTGGMGLNIPYTHSEERPSRMLLSKSSIGGAHSLLLFLMARTPDAPIIKEIKPTAAIAWKKIKFGKIFRRGEPIPLYDCSFSDAETLDAKFKIHKPGSCKKLSGEYLEAPYIDTGENGMFSYAEFMTITSIGQMGYVTPEEIARNLIFEIMGGNTGYDIINALDNATLGPTYRAGTLRDYALDKLQSLSEKYGDDVVAFEILGPPRLSKLLYEAHLLKKVCTSMERVMSEDERKLAQKIELLLQKERKLRSAIISIGIPILTLDGIHLIRGTEIKIPPRRAGGIYKLTKRNIDRWAHDGWIDLRPENMRRWKERFKTIAAEITAMPKEDTSSHYEWNKDYWQKSKAIEIGKVVAWIFVNEDKGLRMKS
jgi:hypothetical protein